MNILSKFIIVLIIFTTSMMNFCADDDSAFKVVNRKTSLGHFVPKDLVNFEDVKVSKRIVSDLQKLLGQAKKDGLVLKVVSGYRSYEYQKKVFERWTQKELTKNKKLTYRQAQEIANGYSARPGHSEHQLGTAVDILSDENNFQFSSEPHLKYITWLEKNCEKYNFKISYPKDISEYIYEPWHLRWHPAKAK